MSTIPHPPPRQQQPTTSDPQIENVRLPQIGGSSPRQQQQQQQQTRAASSSSSSSTKHHHHRASTINIPAALLRPPRHTFTSRKTQAVLDKYLGPNNRSASSSNNVIAGVDQQQQQNAASGSSSCVLPTASSVTATRSFSGMQEPSFSSVTNGDDRGDKKTTAIDTAAAAGAVVEISGITGQIRRSKQKPRTPQSYLSEQRLKKAVETGRGEVRAQTARYAAMTFTPVSESIQSSAQHRAPIVSATARNGADVAFRMQRQFSERFEVNQDSLVGRSDHDDVRGVSNRSPLFGREESNSLRSAQLPRNRTLSVASRSLISLDSAEVAVPVPSSSAAAAAAVVPFQSRNTEADMIRLLRAIDVCTMMNSSVADQQNYQQHHHLLSPSSIGGDLDFPDWGGGGPLQQQRANQRSPKSPRRAGANNAQQQAQQGLQQKSVHFPQQQQQQLSPATTALQQPQQHVIHWDKSDLSGLPLPAAATLQEQKEQMRQKRIHHYPVSNRIHIRAAIQSKIDFLRSNSEVQDKEFATVVSRAVVAKRRRQEEQRIKRTTLFAGQFHHPSAARPGKAIAIAAAAASTTSAVPIVSRPSAAATSALVHGHGSLTFRNAKDNAMLGDAMIFRGVREALPPSAFRKRTPQTEQQHQQLSNNDDDDDDELFSDPLTITANAYRSMSPQQRLERVRQQRRDLRFQTIMDSSTAVHLPPDYVLRGRWQVIVVHMLAMRKFVANLIVSKLRLQHLVPTEPEKQLALAALEYQKGSYHAELRLRAVRRIEKALRWWSINRRVKKKRAATLIIRQALRVRMFLKKITTNARSFIDSVLHCQRIARGWLACKKAQLWMMRLQWAKAEGQVMESASKSIVTTDESLLIYEAMISEVLRELRVCFRRAYLSQIDKIEAATVATRAAMAYGGVGGTMHSNSSTPTTASPFSSRSHSPRDQSLQQQHSHSHHHHNHNEIFYRTLEMPLFYRIQPQRRKSTATATSHQQQQQQFRLPAPPQMPRHEHQQQTQPSYRRASSSVMAFKNTSKKSVSAAAHRACAMRHLPLVSELLILVKKARQAMADFELRPTTTASMTGSISLSSPRSGAAGGAASSSSGGGAMGEFSKSVTTLPFSAALISSMSPAEASLGIAHAGLEPAAFWHLVELHLGLACPPPDLSRLRKKRQQQRQEEQQQEQKQQDESNNNNKRANLVFSSNRTAAVVDYSDASYWQDLPIYVPPIIQEVSAAAGASSCSFAPSPLRRDCWQLISIPSALALEVISMAQQQQPQRGFSSSSMSGFL